MGIWKKHAAESLPAEACPSWADLLEWLESDLDPQQMQVLGVHVNVCRGCRERLAFIHDIRRLTASRYSGSQDEADGRVQPGDLLRRA